MAKSPRIGQIVLRSIDRTACSPSTATTCFTDQIVTTNADSGAGSLRQTIIDACDGSTISFDMTQVVSPITLTTAELLIDKNLTITGPGASTLTVMRSTALTLLAMAIGFVMRDRTQEGFSGLEMPLARMLAINLGIGVAVAVLLVGGLLVLNPGGLRDLILADRSPLVPIALLLGGFIVTLGSTAMTSTGWRRWARLRCSTCRTRCG